MKDWREEEEVNGSTDGWLSERKKRDKNDETI